MVSIRRCSAGDVAAIAALEPAGRDYAVQTFAAQSAGRCLYLVAWIDDRPVGSGEVAWGEVPEVKNLHVDVEVRGRGIGSALMAAAEREVAHGPICVGVSEDNPRARGLYRRLGYVPTGRVETYTYENVDDEGQKRTATETSEYLVKTLP